MNYVTNNDDDFNMDPKTSKLVSPDQLFGKNRRIKNIKDMRRSTLDEVNLEHHAIENFNGIGQCSPKQKSKNVRKTVTIQVSF